MKYKLVVCGGTFDHFHKGHESFLRYVFSVGKKIIVGVTSNEYVRNSKIPTSFAFGELRGASKIQKSPLRSPLANFEGQAEFIEPFEKRKQAISEFVKSEGVLDRTEIVKINDLFGPTLSKDFPIDAIVVSEDTKKGAELINERRKKLGLKELNLLIVPQALAEDGKLISSKRIRNGAINRSGKLYVKKEWFDKNLKLTDDLREEFQKPFGELFKDINDSFKNKNYLVITVGDVTTKNFNEKSLGQNISVIDFKVAREKKFSNILELGFAGNENILKADNPAGYITSNLFRVLLEIFKSDIKGKIILQINGEEDLAVLPLVLLSPLNTVIYYGQPSKGVVKVVVSEKSKDQAYNLTSKLKVA